MKTEKHRLLLLSLLLGFLLLCLGGCAARTGPEEPDASAGAGIPEARRVILLQGGSADCEAEGVTISGSEIVIGEPGEY